MSIGSLFSFKRAPFVLPPETLATIGRKEAAANANPFNVEKELELLRAYANLSHQEGWNLIISRWERISEFNPSSPILRSDDAFTLYLHALSNTGKEASISSATTRRDQLLTQHHAALPQRPAEEPVSAPSEQSPPVAPVAEAEALFPATESIPSASSQAKDSTTPVSAPTSSAPLSTSERIAESVLAGKTLQSVVPEVKPEVAAAPAASATGSAPGSGATGSPIHVVVNEPKGAWKGKLFRGIATAVAAALIILTFLSYFLEGAGIARQEKGPSEFEPGKEQKPVKFADVHGVDEAKDELKDVVAFLRDPTSFNALGGKLPKGVLLTGPPGTGKTMLARAVAGEAGVPFLFASASEFEEMYVGVGAKRVRELFEQARKKQPAIIFIDEIDAIGGKRRMDDRQYLKQTLNQLLVEMDGFQQADGVIVMAATNFPESLDKALVRPGRFDRHIAVPLPDVKGRAQIFQQYLKDIVCGPDVDPSKLARGTPGFSGADLQNMVNQAAIQATKEGSKQVLQKHMDWARDRIIMGAERRSMAINDEVKKVTAYHEGGHALAAMYTKGAMPLHKVTCMPRGHSLGHTSQLPKDDRYSVSLTEFMAEIDVSMGGRVAEEMIFGPENVTSGASSDIVSATRVATAMVKRWGFSDKIGRVYLDERTEPISEEKRMQIEEEVKRIVHEGEQRVRALLKSREVELHRLANALLEHETLSEDEVMKVVRGEKLPKITEVIKDELEKVVPPPPPAPIPQPPTPAPKGKPLPAPVGKPAPTPSAPSAPSSPDS
ncbi:ATP-dependent peptidase [Vararia minispora EC-137]|uniref:ATP-dependent peptidase n=1 Tax=Vararia minispora EC-137 TaxID=1314806 RepID=A0ACB8QGJ4_9AGAM|nr:ATP-dependent peptidase [Vararia minispora EC-137]